jgi:hypothetical protein
MGGSGVVLSLFRSWFGLGANFFLGMVCGGIGMIPIFPSLSPLHSPNYLAPSA